MPQGSGDDESEYEYDDRVSLHADDDHSELAGNTLGTNKESEDEDSDSGLQGLIQELDKDEQIGGKNH